MPRITVIFIGTDKIGMPLLEALNADRRFDVKLVITGKDKPKGRKMQMSASPVKTMAQRLGIEIYQPTDINSAESIKLIQKTNLDMIVLMAYGQILNKEVLTAPKSGCINIHASILPKYRGASPIRQALLNNDKTTGISIMKMEEQTDTGSVFKTYKIRIADDENAAALTERLAMLAAEKAPDALCGIAEGKIKARPQNEEKASYCRKISREDGRINWNESADTIAAKVRAFSGWPGTFSFWNGKRLKILSGRALPCRISVQSGTVMRLSDEIAVITGQGALAIAKLQIEGKKTQSINEFVRGCPAFIGARLG